MNASKIKSMDCNECFKAIDYIEMSAKIKGKELTAAQKKLIKALEKRTHELTAHLVED